MIPLIHDFEGERVLVFGGGPVGARKARHFGDEATVVVVSPQFVGGSFGGAEKIRAAPAPDEVSEWLTRVDPALVVAATDDAELNEAIDATAGEYGVLSNRADVSGARDVSSVVVPATVRDDPVVVSVSTGGKSPALSRYLREQIESTVKNSGAMAELTAILREELTDRDGTDRKAALQAVLSNETVWKALDTEGSNPRQVAKEVIVDATGDSI